LGAFLFFRIDVVLSLTVNWHFEQSVSAGG
jgi:hypothetical protein